MSLGAFVWHFHALIATTADQLADKDLLKRFVDEDDDLAFTVLVQRHGPMVLRISRRMLHHVQDAEDAFQATFLVLAEKASFIRRLDKVDWVTVALKSSIHFNRDYSAFAEVNLTTYLGRSGTVQNHVGFSDRGKFYPIQDRQAGDNIAPVWRLDSQGTGCVGP